jgi:hypothetical protein
MEGGPVIPLGLNNTKIHGTTWNVYLYIVTSKEPKGVRSIWRGLQLSSPSLAQYHINKLVDLEFITSTPEGKYQMNEEKPVELLNNFLRFRGKLIPRLLIYGTFLFGILVSYLLFWPFRWDFRDIITLTVCVFGMLAFFFEAYKQYRTLSVVT